MSDDELLAAFAGACRGSTCVVKRRDYDWAISFGSGQIVMSAIWRLVSNGRIAFGSADDHHQFGLIKPVDGEALANDLLFGRKIVAIEIDLVMADFSIRFESDMHLDLFNGSMGYEGWQASLDGKNALIIGRGGGGVVII